MNFNDIANERYPNFKGNDNDNDKSVNQVKREARTHAENEQLAHQLQERFNAPRWEPFLAVCYSGIPRETITRHAVKASELGRNPVKLFMFLVGQEPQWRNYQELKVIRDAEEQQNGAA